MNMQRKYNIQVQQAVTFVMQKKHMLNHSQSLCQVENTSEDKTQVRNEGLIFKKMSRGRKLCHET
ncbi:Uncharacterised protein [Chlamydia trachomatis]|nr:Uncharacterised protein [Chlamydia trachomatis]